MTKPSLPQGTRDFGPDTVRKRQYILNTIKNVFNLYGFQPLETPAMENLETLMGKYGEEGDKLIFRILDSGIPFTKDFFSGLRDYFKDIWDHYKDFNERSKKFAEQQGVYGSGPLEEEFLNISPAFLADSFRDLGSKYLPALKNEITQKALRYDLTIPFARYVAMNHSQLPLPFKRYQMQPVWRADRPQKGRYREFYQCDADIVGSTALLNEIELANIYKHVFEKLHIPVEIKLNSRKILAALADVIGGGEKLTDITTAIDKLDKIGLEKVKEELLQRGLTQEQVKTISDYLSITGDNRQKLDNLKELFTSNESGLKGIDELNYILEHLPLVDNAQCRFVADLTLARGLNYYNGIIFEVKAKAVQMGSIGGGGRYDDLTGLFGVPNIPGVGISFGVDRIYDVMEELKLFPADIEEGSKVLFFNLGEKESSYAYNLLQQLRKKGIAAEIFHESAKMDKQFKYAEKKKIPYVIIIGSRELEQGMVVVKKLDSGEQQTIEQNKLVSFFS